MLRRVRISSVTPHAQSVWSRAQCVQVFTRNSYCTTGRASSSEPHAPTPVEKLLYDSIRASGPIPVSTYLQLCLSHPTEGYYMRPRSNDHDVFGAQGDFTTSPEISQVFGELVCLWFLSVWRNTETGSPFPKIRLVELGPGRGTLMDDILRTLSMWHDSRNAVTSVHLIENSPMMRSRQQQKLAKWFELQNIQCHWWNSIEDIPAAAEDEFSMVVAHEFFDALPVNILEKTPNGFREVLIDLQPSSASLPVTSHLKSRGTPPSKFRFVLSPAPTARSDFLSTLSPRFATLPSGSRVEVSAPSWRTARNIGEIISGNREETAGGAEKRIKSKGAALIIDYGDEHAFGASFRAFRAHRQVDVFDQPGRSDLTTNVDFALLKEALDGVATPHGILDQASFLLRMGVKQRLAALARTAKSEERGSEISRAGGRLIDPTGQGMGKVYQVLGVTGAKGSQKAEIWPFVSSLHKDSEK